MSEENVLSKIIIGAAIEVHRQLGPGLLESLYEEALAYELELRGCQVKRQQAVPVAYKGKILSAPLRLDIRVNDLVLVDTKSVIEYNKIFDAQMLTYLRLTGLKLGLVINFGEHYVKNGIHRIANGLKENHESPTF